MDNANHITKNIVMAVANNSYPQDPRVRHEAETLVEAGHRLTVIAPQSKAQSYYAIVNNVRVVRYPSFDGHGILGYTLEFVYVTIMTTLLVLVEWLWHGMDVLHVHNPPDTLFIAALIPKLFGKKFIFDHHDLAPELYIAKFNKDRGLVYRALLLFERLSCWLADGVITVNESYKENDIQRNHIEAEHIVVVRNAPTLANLNSVEPDAQLRKRASILVGYLGHIAKQDGVDHLIKALHCIETDYNFTDWYAVIVGSGEDLDNLQQLAQQLGISNKIWFAGYRPNAEWRKLLASCDVCLVPDPANPLNEKSTMIKTMDYMALGKPVVAYDMRENRVSGGDAALYAEPSNPADLARHLMNLINNPDLRHTLGNNGRNRIKNALAWEYSADALKIFYESNIFTG